MEDSVAAAFGATQARIPQAVSPRSLAAAFARISDPRRLASVESTKIPVVPSCFGLGRG